MTNKTEKKQLKLAPTLADIQEEAGPLFPIRRKDLSAALLMTDETIGTIPTGEESQTNDNTET